MKRVAFGGLVGGALAALVLPGHTQHQVPPDGPALGQNRITQAEVTSGRLSIRELRRKGLEIFSTPFNKLDGYGDGPMNPANPVVPGGRPTIGGNNTWLRINGLDTQTCLECHSVLSNAFLPATFSPGGVGGIGASAFPGVTEFDLEDLNGNLIADINGRAINPPFVFGAGGVELLGKEMTVELQGLKRLAQSIPNTRVPLVTKGVSFGAITYDARTGTFDISEVEGIDPDLVVRPFGRKGDNNSVRTFSTGALQFHHGMQPVEVVGRGVDDDGDGVVNEILPGELSAIHIFGVSMEHPVRRARNRPLIAQGFENFVNAGCATCHVPALQTDSTLLNLAFPEVQTDPTANVYLTIDLAGGSAGFGRNDRGGVRVELFSDLKRHDMGPELAETTGSPLDPFFITPRLWGAADTAPYLHDARALTLREAIEQHGGEAQFSARRFGALPPREQKRLLGFLLSLRTPRNPSANILRLRR